MAADFERAKQFVFSKLAIELPSHLYYHNLGHTRDDVLPAATRLAGLTGLKGEWLLLLQTAAVYHDIGFIEQTAGHEAISVKMAAESLPNFGYNPLQIQIIVETIWATQLPQTPTNQLGEFLADADLDALGRENFLEVSRRYRLELEAQGLQQTDQDWYSNQLSLLESHTYFTSAAKSLRAAQKQENIAALKALWEKPGKSPKRSGI